MLPFHKLRYMLHRAGFTITRIGTNRIKPVSLLYAVLLPLTYLATWWTLRTAEKDPEQRVRNREIMRHRRRHTGSDRRGGTRRRSFRVGHPAA